MSTKHSPLNQLRAESNRIAELLKKLERGELQAKDNARQTKDSLQFGVVMDDKILQITMTWAEIAAKSEAQLSDFILRQMRESRVGAN